MFSNTLWKHIERQLNIHGIDASNLKVLENLYEGWRGAIDKMKKENESKGGAA